MKKPFENKKAYDPGRMRTRVTFVQNQMIDTPDGGTTEFELNVLTTWAGRDKVSDYNQMAITAGATLENTPTYFTIRNRKVFYPDKKMKLKTTFNEYFTILGIVALDEPCTFIQMLCVRTK